MGSDTKFALVTGAGTGIGKAVALALLKDGYASRSPAGARAARASGAEAGEAPGRTRSSCPPTSPTRPRSRAVRANQGDLRPPRPPVQQRRHRRAGRAARGPHLRAMEGGGRHQPHRRVPVHAGSVPAHEGAGARAAAASSTTARSPPTRRGPTRRPTRDEARDHRPHQVDLARRPQVRHRLRPDRHRQRRDAEMAGRMAKGVPQANGSVAVEPLMDVEHVAARRASTWRACRSTRTCSS